MPEWDSGQDLMQSQDFSLSGETAGGCLLCFGLVSRPLTWAPVFVSPLIDFPVPLYTPHAECSTPCTSLCTVLLGLPAFCSLGGVRGPPVEAPPTIVGSMLDIPHVQYSHCTWWDWATYFFLSCPETQKFLGLLSCLRLSLLSSQSCHLKVL